MMEHKIKYPFIMEEVEAIWEVVWEVAGTEIPKIEQWKPGITYTQESPYQDGEAYCEGEGFMVITEISRHKLPRPYPTRVFFTRKWIDPDGKKFGSNKLNIISLGTFNKIIKGYYGPEYILDSPAKIEQADGLVDTHLLEQK